MARRACFPFPVFPHKTSIIDKTFTREGNLVLIWIRQNLLWYRILLVAALVLVWLAFKPVIAVYCWVIFLIGLGKFYEIFFLRGGQDWGSTAFSLKLMVMSKLAEYVWDGFREGK
jgi:hypothetical protein